MFNNKDNEDDCKQPCVVFESINAWLVTAENLRYIDHGSNQFYTRKWKIMNFDLDDFRGGKDEWVDIFFETTIYFREDTDSVYVRPLEIKVDDRDIEWLGYADLLPVETHINADTELCDLKFNSILFIMRKAAEIDVNFAIEMHEENIACI